MRKNILIERKKKADVSRGTSVKFEKYSAFNNHGYRAYNVIDSLIIDDKYTKNSYDKRYSVCVAKNLQESLDTIRHDTKKNNDKLEQFIRSNFLKTTLFDFFKQVEHHEDENVIKFLDSVPRGNCYRTESYALLDMHIAKFWDMYKKADFFDKRTLKKQQEEIKNFSNAPVREKVLREMVAMLTPIFSERGYELDLSKVAVCFDIEMKGKVLVRCYHESCDGGSADVEKNLLRQIAIRGSLYKNEDGKVTYNPNKIDDVLAVLVHELVHGYLGIEEKHGAKFKKMCKNVGLKGSGQNDAKFTSTQPNDEFKTMYAEILKLNFPATEFDIQRETKSNNKKLKCPVCGMRCVVTNQAQKHAQVNLLCDHNGTDFEDYEPSVMEQYESKKK